MTITPTITPFPQSYWVLPGQLLAGPYPGHYQPEQAAPRLRALFNCGIRHVINLMEPDEVNWQGQAFTPYLDDLRAYAAGMSTQMEWNRYPIRDGSITDRATMIRILDEIDTALAAGQPVYVHCWGGKGRTGTVIGCYLARHGLANGQQALERIKALRGMLQPYQLSPETGDQCEMVKAWRIGV